MHMAKLPAQSCLMTTTVPYITVTAISAKSSTHRQKDLELATGLVLVLQHMAPLQLQPAANLLLVLWRGMQQLLQAVTDLHITWGDYIPPALPVCLRHHNQLVHVVHLCL